MVVVVADDHDDEGHAADDDHDDDDESHDDGSITGALTVLMQHAAKTALTSPNTSLILPSRTVQQRPKMWKTELDNRDQCTTTTSRLSSSLLGQLASCQSLQWPLLQG